MILTVTKCHENLLRVSPLSSLSIVKFFSSLETKKMLKIPNETFLRNTLYIYVYFKECNRHPYAVRRGLMMQGRLQLMAGRIELKLKRIGAFIPQTKNLVPRSSEVSERASERMSAAEHTSEANSAEQAVPANEQTEEQMAHYYTRRFQTHCALCPVCRVARSCPLCSYKANSDICVPFAQCTMQCNAKGSGNKEYLNLKSYFDAMTQQELAISYSRKVQGIFLIDLWNTCPLYKDAFWTFIRVNIRPRVRPSVGFSIRHTRVEIMDNSHQQKIKNK